MGMILRIASSRIVGQGDIVGRSGYFSLNLSANSVMRGRLDARRTLKSLVADLRYNTLLDMKIQEVMKLQRKALGITQQDLADMSEIAISTIKKIESGKGNPSLSTVEKIMDILGMEVKYEIRQTV